MSLAMNRPRVLPAVPDVRGSTSDVEHYLIAVGRVCAQLCSDILDAYLALARSFEAHGSQDEALRAAIVEAFAAGKAAIEQGADAMQRAAESAAVSLLDGHRQLRAIRDAGGVREAEARHARDLERAIDTALRNARRELERLAQGAVEAQQVAAVFDDGLRRRGPEAALPALQRALEVLARVVTQAPAVPRGFDA